MDASSVKTEFLPAAAGQKLKVTAWVLSDLTESEEDLFAMSFVSASNTGVGGGIRAKIPKDTPCWSKLELEAILPERTAKVNVLIVMKSKKGGIWVDDVSLMLEGKEILKNGSFEEK